MGRRPSLDALGGRVHAAHAVACRHPPRGDAAPMRLDGADQPARAQELGPRAHHSQGGLQPARGRVAADGRRCRVARGDVAHADEVLRDWQLELQVGQVDDAPLSGRLAAVQCLFNLGASRLTSGDLPFPPVGFPLSSAFGTSSHEASSRGSRPIAMTGTDIELAQ